MASQKRQDKILSGEVDKSVPQLDGEHQGLVHQPTTVVGTSHAGVVLSRLCQGDCLGG